MKNKVFIKPLFLVCFFCIGFFSTNVFSDMIMSEEEQEMFAEDFNNTNTPEQKCKSGSTPGTWFESTKLCECPEATKNIDGVCRSCAEKDVCCGIKLNTKVPFIGNCIEFAKNCKDGECPNSGYQCINGKCRVVKNDPSQTVVDQEEAFPILMGGLVKILVTIIILAGFIGILAGGVMISAAGSDDQKAAKGKKLIINVAIAIAILGASGVILRLINPNFFG